MGESIVEVDLITMFYTGGTSAVTSRRRVTVINAQSLVVRHVNFKQTWSLRESMARVMSTISLRRLWRTS
jgi:hypothetical protein